MLKINNTTIHDLHQNRLNGSIKTTEIIDAIYQQIDIKEKDINAFIFLCKKEDLLQQGELADDLIKKGDPINPIQGMPIAIKDIFNIKGLGTTCASKILNNYISPYESTVTQKLKNVGYNLIGKTNMDEFAMGSSNENSVFGPVHNPWNLDYVPGGSSGGSAAAVAANMALASIGTDTGGSIRQPASFTNLVGIKPTYGRVSRYGMVAFASSFDQAGPLAKDVQDAALILQTIAGYDPKDATSLNIPVSNYQSYLNQPINNMKIGIIKELEIEKCHPEVQDIFHKNLEFFQKQGAELVEISIPELKYVIATYYIIATSEASSNLGRYDGIRYGYRDSEALSLQDMYANSRNYGFGQEVKLRILLGTFALSAGYYDAYYLKAQKIQNMLRAKFKKTFQKVDAIATPVSPIPPFKIGEKTQDPLQMYLSDIFTIPANLTGIPAISIPAGFTKNNLPIGLQLLGDHLQEGKLIQIAHNFEQNK